MDKVMSDENLTYESLLALRDELANSVINNEAVSGLVLTVGVARDSLVVVTSRLMIVDELETMGLPQEWKGVSIEYKFLGNIV